MRRSLALALLLLAAFQAAAVARGVSHGHVSAFRHQRLEHRHFRQIAPFAPGLWYWGDWDDELFGYGFGLPGPVALAAPPPVLVPRDSELDERPTVEHTPQGVTIVRGPGSHHLWQ